MTAITLTALVVGALLLGTAITWWLRRRRRLRQAPTGHREPASLVRLLQRGAELDEAVRRAAHFEEAVERGVANRRRHYAELLGAGITSGTAEPRIVQLEVRPATLEPEQPRAEEAQEQAR